jgi:hypothetical protein
MKIILIRFAFFNLLLFSTSWAQLIGIKSVPVATGDQFLIFPGRSTGMGGVSVALQDSLLDPFSNPVRGRHLNQPILTVSPVYYTIADDNGSARTIPLAFQFNQKTWFGGLYASAQDLDISKGDGIMPAGGFQRLSNTSLRNTYVSAYAGFPLRVHDLTIAASVFYADLEGMDGVELLYSDNSNLEQNGQFLDLRLGLHKEFSAERSLEALLIYHDFKMTHEVDNLFWTDQPWLSATERRVEKHTDHSRTHGFHLNFRQPWGRNGWKLGTMATVNRKTHPKIPNYELMNIPRDPGDSWAYNFGIGVCREAEGTIVGIDMIYEPIWSTTWADAATEMTTRSGRIIRPGQKTIENEFTFSNAIFRFGLSHGPNGKGFQFGLQAYSYRYWLDQYDYVEEMRRKQNEQWTEWILSWGWFGKFDKFELRYMGRMISGTGQPGIATSWFMRDMAFTSKNDILLAPEGALTLNETNIFTHQLVLIIPLDRF